MEFDLLPGVWIHSEVVVVVDVVFIQDVCSHVCIVGNVYIVGSMGCDPIYGGDDDHLPEADADADA